MKFNYLKVDWVKWIQSAVNKRSLALMILDTAKREKFPKRDCCCPSCARHIINGNLAMIVHYYPCLSALPIKR